MKWSEIFEGEIIGLAADAPDQISPYKIMGHEAQIEAWRKYSVRLFRLLAEANNKIKRMHA